MISHARLAFLIGAGTLGCAVAVDLGDPKQAHEAEQREIERREARKPPSREPTATDLERIRLAEAKRARKADRRRASTPQQAGENPCD